MYTPAKINGKASRLAARDLKKKLHMADKQMKGVIQLVDQRAQNLRVEFRTCTLLALNDLYVVKIGHAIQTLERGKNVKLGGVTREIQGHSHLTKAPTLLLAVIASDRYLQTSHGI
jgi:hypothetical protein